MDGNDEANEATRGEEGEDDEGEDDEDEELRPPTDDDEEGADRESSSLSAADERMGDALLVASYAIIVFAFGTCLGKTQHCSPLSMHMCAISYV